MDTSVNLIYAFRSITHLTVSREPIQRKLQSRFPWMLLGIAGSGHVHASAEGDAVTRLVPGSALVGAAGSASEGIVLQPELSKGEWKLYWMEFLELEIHENANVLTSLSAVSHMSSEGASWLPEGEIVFAAQADELAPLAERLYYAMHMQADNPQQSLVAHMLVQQMMVWWHGEGMRRNASIVQPTTEQSVMSVAHYMEDHYGEPLTREQLARMAGVADAYFSILFKKMIGVQPSVYLERLRAHRAAELLLLGRENRGDLTEVALASGFRDSWYMSKRFKGLMGVGPSLFRTSFVPERIASLQYPYTHHLLALGVMPVAARFGQGMDAPSPDVRKETNGFPALLSIEGQRQLLSDSRPQLILTYDTEDKGARWRGVAPVIYIPWLGTDWRGHLRAIGSLLLREQAAEALIKRLDGIAGEVRRQISGKYAPGTTVSVFKLENNRCYLYGVRDVGCIFYEMLGFEPPAQIKNKLTGEPNLHSMEIPMRQMAECAGDVNVVILSPDSDQHSHLLQTNEHWRSFEVASSHRLIYLDYRDWLHYDPIYIEAQLKKIPDILGVSSL
jgi:ABC-type Fe3+-hydroxamate transport system substrate-binding protein